MKSRIYNTLSLVVLFLWVFTIAGCASTANQAVTSSPQATFTPFQPLPPGVQATFSQPDLEPQQKQDDPSAAGDLPEEIPSVQLLPRVYINPWLPEELHKDAFLPPGWELTGKTDASIFIDYGEETPLYWWMLTLAAPFAFLHDGISTSELVRTWHGEPQGILVGRKIYMDKASAAAMTWLLGEPAAETVVILPAADLMAAAWKKPAGLAILPFDLLEPRWKVLTIDGISPIQRGMQEEKYLLRIPVSARGDAQLVQQYLHDLQGETSASLAVSNRDESQMTILAMTGVTALVRATAHTMELQGITYPAGDVGDLLRGADLTHISNEVPFAENCPYPNPVQADVTFCSDQRYIELLEYVGTDIVELTGDHFADWGTDAMYTTLQMYEQRGWLFYGGGYNIADGKKPVTVEHNGNRLAFIGCNGKGGQFASAGVDSPGSVACDFDYLEKEIRRLRDEGYLPIATFQHFEYYSYHAQPRQLEDFRRLAEAGAVIVSGSQAHQPQAMEFYSEAFIHYGLGNLFFDQYLLGEPTRQGLIDLHVFYAGRHISTEVVTLYFIDFARPRLMDAGERKDLLGTLFFASDW